MTMDEYLFRTGKQPNMTPLKQAPLVLSAPQQRRRRKERQRMAVAIATSPLWVPLLPVILPAAGVVYLSCYIYKHSDDWSTSWEQKRLDRRLRAGKAHRMTLAELNAESRARQMAAV
jgi:hypothetical protein